MVKKVLALCLVALLCFPGACRTAAQQAATFLQQAEGDIPLQMNGALLQVKVVTSMAEQERGLSGQAMLEQDKGMLFVYRRSSRYSFWMKEMRFPIDIIWIDEQLTVIDVSPNAQPDSFPQAFYPSEPARYVLEVNAGWAARHNIKKGSSLRL